MSYATASHSIDVEGKVAPNMETTSSVNPLSIPFDTSKADGKRPMYVIQLNAETTQRLVDEFDEALRST